MTKIKNFRITLRPREIARFLKTHDRLQVTPALEASVEHAISDSKRWLQPAALYTTLTRATLEKTVALPVSDRTISVSLIAATIGDGLQREGDAAAERQDTMQASLLRALQQEALSQSVQFAVRLLQEQAKEEECEISAPADITTAPLLPALSTLLGIQRIGIDLDAAAPQLPPYARVVWMEWLPQERRSSKRGESPARTDKTAVSQP